MPETITQLLVKTRKNLDLPEDPARDRSWSFKVIGLTIHLPNFTWRKDAIDKHDLHHLVLGEPFTMRGECQVATWEFAAGAFPDKRAQLFCLPLVAIGAITSPQRTWRSFKAGATQRSLFEQHLIGSETLGEITRLTRNARTPASNKASLKLDFVKLLASSAGLYLLPAALCLLFFIKRVS